MPDMSRLNLVKLLVILFVVFVGLGWAVSSVFSKYNSRTPQENTQLTPDQNPDISYEGIITYIDPNLNPGEEISYYLADSLGNEIILLKSEDHKLEVSEGHRATVLGKARKTSAGRDYLLVSKVVIKNGTN